MTGAFVSALFVVFGTGISAFAVLLSRAHLKRVERVVSGQTAALAVALKRLPLAERLGALLTRAPRGSMELRLAEELRDARDEGARSDALSDVLSDIDLALEASASWPNAAARIAAYGCLLFAALALLTRSGPYPAATLVLVGVIGAASCVSLGERAKKLAREQRRAFDALIDALVQRERVTLAKGAKRSKS